MPTSNYTGAPVTLNLGISSTNVQLNQNTYYRLWSSVNAFFQFGVDNTTTASLLSHPLTAGLDTLHYTGTNLFWIAGIVSTGSGVLYCSVITSGAAG